MRKQRFYLLLRLSDIPDHLPHRGTFRGFPFGRPAGLGYRLGRTGFRPPSRSRVFFYPCFVYRGEFKTLENAVDLAGILGTDQDVRVAVLGCLVLQDAIENTILFGLDTKPFEVSVLDRKYL